MAQPKFASAKNRIADPNEETELAAPAHVDSNEPFSDEVTPALAQVRRARDAASREGRGHRAALALFAFGVALVCVASLRETSRAPSDAGPSLGGDEFRRRMELHLAESRAQSEFRLIAGQSTALEARRAAASAADDALPDRAVAFGAPLETQPYHLSAARLEGKQTKFIGQGLEERVRAGVKDDREALAWEERARRQFIADFTRNALAAGWQVQVDKDLNVVYQRVSGLDGADGRRPQSESAPVRVPWFASYCPALGR